MSRLDVDKVFRFVQFVANKESRGWVSVAEFNIAAELAQIIAYSKREAIFVQTKKIGNDMRYFTRSLALSTNASGYLSNASIVIRHIISLRFRTSGSPIKELIQGEIADALDSTIVAPSTDYPAFVWRYNITEDEDQIQIYPIQDALTVDIECLVYPTAPEWIDDFSGARPVYDSVASTQFGFDEILFPEIAGLVLANVGMNIKEEAVTQYGLAFNAQ